ncbi:hypothetical protein F2Q68_00039027 [Brassica cretica]|uniref:Uncharacterized protein n=2 Tax=Brassica cretica TaxID=69181 RepID=A0A8S9MQT9_BRACR|nr:hypothetical protein F2Q68_00039027 [Brassica cretica]KAF3496064.1 hypothetical protein DY000_02052608 [Brassica cretica]
MPSLRGDAKQDVFIERRCEVKKRKKVDPTGQEECVVGDAKQRESDWRAILKREEKGGGSHE